MGIYFTFLREFGIIYNTVSFLSKIAERNILDAEIFEKILVFLPPCPFVYGGRGGDGSATAGSDG